MRKSLVGFVCAVVALSIWIAPASGAVISEFDFEAVNGNSVPNLAISPDGILLEDAVVADGVLVTEGVGSGLDLSLGALNPFGGEADWSVQFDFRSEDDGGGPLFSSDSSACDDECNDAVAAGSLNIFLTGEGEVVADAWFIGAIGAFSPEDEPLNDGEFHTVKLDYTADGGLWELFIDDLDEPAAEAEWPYARDASQDRTRIGDQTNPDFGFEDIDPGEDGLAADFDNFIIDAPSPPPVQLIIDRETGAATLKSISGEDVDFNRISITSDSGSLLPEEWASLSSQPESQLNVEVSSAEELSETGTGKIQPDDQFALGNIWVKSPLNDVRLSIFDTNLEESVRGAITYEGDPSLFADLDNDGELTPSDWELFVAGYGSDLVGLTGVEGYFLADLNTDGIYNAEDFVAFSEAYDAFHGDGAFDEMVAAVPEPTGFLLLGLAALGSLAVRGRRQFRLQQAVLPVLVCFTAFALVATSETRADLLVEYTFEDGADDSSGNGRDGDLDSGFEGTPEIADGVLSMTGGFEEGLIIPLGDANPFDGSKDFTIDVSFQALLHEDEAGHLLLSSANVNDPTNGDNQSMSLFIEPEGDIVYDTFFVGEVRVTPPEIVIDDGNIHDLRVTYLAPTAEDEPGTMFMRLDNVWLGTGEIQPEVPAIEEHEVRLGGSLNDEFPFECEGSECFIREFLGDLDNVRVFDEAFAPSAFSVEVDRNSGDIRLKGGEFARDVEFYEIISESGALDSGAWEAGNLDTQNVDSLGEEAGQTWDALSGDANRIAEAFLLGSTLFDADTTLTLPGAWGGGAEDLEVQFVTTDKEILSAAVNYVGEAPQCDDATQGDIDGSGTVDFTDFLILSANFGADILDHTKGDLDCSGSVDFTDFLILSANFGSEVAVAESVPEPSTGLWMLPLILLGLRLRQKKN